MSYNRYADGMVDGIFIGVVISLLVVFIVLDFKEIQGRKPCEANLPRTQVCKIVWVPEEKKEK